MGPKCLRFCQLISDKLIHTPVRQGYCAFNCSKHVTLQACTLISCLDIPFQIYNVYVVIKN